MANKEAVFTLRVNTGNSVKDVQSFDAAVQNLNKDIQEVQQTASSGTGIDSFDAKLQELNAKVEAGGLTMRQMTQVMKEYQTIAAQAGMESPIGQQAIQNAAELKDQIGDLKSATTALSSDFVGLDTAVAGIETGAAVFQGFESAVALTGVESEALVQTMVKLQAIQGVVNAVTTVANNLNKESILGIQLRNAVEKVGNFIKTGSFKAIVAQTTATKGLAAAEVGAAAATTGVSTAMKVLRAALIASGIGAIIVLLGTAADALGLFGDSTDEAAEKQKKLDRAIESTNTQISAMEDLYQKVADTQKFAIDMAVLEAQKRGASQSEINKIMEDGAQERLNILKRENDEALALYLQLSKSGANEQFKAAESAYLASNERVQQAQQEYKKLTIENEIAAKKAAADAAEKRKQDAKDAAEQAKKARKDVIQALQDQYEYQISLERQYQQNKIDAMAEGQEKEIAAAKLSFEEYKQEVLDKAISDELQAEALKYEEGKIKREVYEANIAAIRLNSLDKLTEEEKKLITSKEEVLNKEIEVIDKKYSDESIQKKIEEEEKKLDLVKKYRYMISDEYQQDLIDFEATQEDQAKALGEALANKLITNEEYLAAQEVLEQQYADKIKEIEEKKLQVQKDADKKKFEANISQVTQAIEIAQQALDSLSAINDLVNQAQENQIAEAKAQADEQKSIYDKQQAEELANTALTAEQRKSIEDKYNKLRYQAELKAFQEEDKLKKQQFERDKAFKIAQIAIDTASAITKAIATYGPPPNPLAIFGIATASTIGIAQAAAVAATQYKSSTPPSMAGGSAGSMTGASASTFTAANTNTQQTNLSDILGQGGTNQGTMSKVYVLESDITTTQQKVSVQEQLSTY